MKTKLAYLFLVLGAVGLIGQILYRLQREKQLLETQMSAQQSSLVDGLKSSWKSYLLQKARAGELEKTFHLRWNRKGSELRESFYPVKPASMAWEKYRHSLIEKNHDATKAFLERALNRHNSWDRILAISEWKNRYEVTPEIKTEYEKTLINPEAKVAYRLIFSQFAKNKDFTFTSSEVEYDQVFYSVAKDGSIEAFVPSAREIEKSLLPHFIKQHNLPSASLNHHPWELLLPPSIKRNLTFSYLDFFWLIAAMILFLLGMVTYFSSLREQKKSLIKRISFLNQVVHELKTPLSGLKLHLQLIQKGQGGEKNLNALNTSIDRLNKLFDDVVFMNRPFEPIEPKLISFEEANEILEAFASEFSQLKVEKKFSQGFYGDKKRVRIVLRNLIKNGIRYGKNVTVDVSGQGDRITIHVKDNGPGVPTDESHRIFQEFYRSEAAKKVNADGLGLGLHLVKKMAQEMGATVKLSNPGEQGAIFQIILRGANE